MAGTSHVQINNVSVVISGEPIEVLVGAGGFDALVSSEDTNLSMAGGVSKAIRIAAGEAIADEARRLVPLRVGDVAVTSAGELPAHYVLHAVTVDWDLPVRPSELTIRLAAENVFRRCELLQVRRLAMPALGIGAAQFGADHSARLILQALAKHSVRPTTIKQVVFSLPDPEALRAFSVFLEQLKLRGDLALSGDTGELQTGMPASSRLGSAATRTNVLKRLFSRRRHTADLQTKEAPGLLKLAAESQQSRPLVGNRYVLLEELGRGGMAIVYLGWDIVLRQIVAVKTLLPGEHMARERIDSLRQEAALQIGLIHHGIVRLFNFEPWDSSVGPFIIMEYVPWTSGERWMAEAGLSYLPLRAVLRVGICLCEAVVYAHGANVLHGDIKPSNVFVDPGADAAKLADFGIARVVGGSERNALVTKLIGTPAYMAPEQKTVGAKVGPRTDLYLLARTLADFMGARVNPQGDITLPDHVSATATGAVIRRGLAPNPTDRPADAREFGRLLQHALSAVA